MTRAGLASTDVEQVFRAESGRALASLIRFLGDIDLAEEAVQESFLVALEKWPTTGPPPNPAGWIITTARNRAIDRLRRESKREAKHADAALLHQSEEREGTVMLEDDRLRLIFTCCHPALSAEAQVALTLRLIAGLATGEVARAFLVSETAMAQRLTRAKGKIRKANIPYRIPQPEQLPDRLRPVLAVIYLIYNEGHTATEGGEPLRDDLCQEAIRLARLLSDLMPDEPEVIGLLALLLLTEARRPARLDEEGRLLRLAEQDRRRWDRSLIEEGHDLVRACLRRNRPGPYQVQAAINAVHTDAVDAVDTDWPQILALYDQLIQLNPSSVVALNRSIARAEVTGPAVALEEIERLELSRYHLFHAARADLLERLGRREEADQAYRIAMDLTRNEAERELLARRRRQLGVDS